MPVQSVEPLREGIAAQVSMPNRWLWTWGGVCFGYRQEEWLFTYDGIGVGRFVGDEVYGTSGDYLGELRSTEQEQRLATSNYKKSRVAAAFSPKVQSGYERPANRLPQTLYCGYQDFPSPEIFKKVEARGALHSRSEILSAFNTKREATPGARSNEGTGAQAVATPHQQVPHIEHAISVDATALAKLFGTADQYNDTCELENAASSESNSILAKSNLTQPILMLGKSGKEAAPSQADQRAEHLRLVLSNIKRRRAQAYSKKGPRMMPSDPLQTEPSRAVNVTCNPRTDPQPGDEIRIGGQIRQIVRRDGDDLWCQDGAVCYKTTVQRWHEWVLIKAGMTRLLSGSSIGR